MKIMARFFYGVAGVVLASGVLFAAEPATDTVVVADTQVAEPTVAVEPQPVADVAVSDVAGAAVASVQPQVIDQADQASLATYGMAVARCMIYEALQRHTPIDDNTPQRQVLWNGILFYGALTTCSAIAFFGGGKGCIDILGVNEASVSVIVAMSTVLVAGFVSSILACDLTKKAIDAYEGERQAFLTEPELQAMLKSFGKPKASTLTESLAAVKQWFSTIQSNLCDLGYQKTLSLFDVQLHQVMVKVNDVLAEKALIDQKRHPSEQEVAEIQAKLAGALGNFAVYVLTVLNDKENYLRQAN
jgi:hypothetical protein